MELEKLTALQLGEKIKQRQVSVLDGVKTVFEQNVWNVRMPV